MTVQNVNGKKINKTNHTSPYVHQQRTDRLDDFFKKGGSIFNAPGVQKSSNSGQMAEGRSLGNDAESRTAFSKDSIQKLKDSQTAIETGTQQANAKNNIANSQINLAGRTIGSLVKKSEKLNSEIKSLEAERDALPTEETSSDSANNPFAVFSLNMSGGAANANNTDNKKGGLLTQGNQDVPQKDQNVKAPENEENQQKAAEIDSKIASKKATLATTHKTITKTTKHAGSVYKNNIKQMALAARKAKQAQEAAKAAKAKATGETMQIASTAQSVGGVLTATGTAISSTGWGGAVGAQMISIGGYTSAAGAGLQAVASAESGNASGAIDSTGKAISSIDNGIKKSKEVRQNNANHTA